MFSKRAKSSSAGETRQQCVARLIRKEVELETRLQGVSNLTTESYSCLEKLRRVRGEVERRQDHHQLSQAEQRAVCTADHNADVTFNKLAFFCDDQRFGAGPTLGLRDGLGQAAVTQELQNARNQVQVAERQAEDLRSQLQAMEAVGLDQHHRIKELEAIVFSLQDTVEASAQPQSQMPTLQTEAAQIPLPLDVATLQEEAAQVPLPLDEEELPEAPAFDAVAAPQPSQPTAPEARKKAKARRGKSKTIGTMTTVTMENNTFALKRKRNPINIENQAMRDQYEAETGNSFHRRRSAMARELLQLGVTSLIVPDGGKMKLKSGRLLEQPKEKKQRTRR